MANFAFLHGGGQGSWVWQETREQLQQLSPGVATLGLDIPGCGAKRGRDTTGLTFNDLVAELCRDTRACSEGEWILVGHSQAGTLMPFMHQRHPDLFRHLVYVSCSLPLPGQTVAQMMGSGQHGEHPDQVGWAPGLDTNNPLARNRYLFCNDMSEAQYRRYRQQLGRDQWPACSYTTNDWPLLSPATNATYVACTQDNILPLDWQYRFAKRLQAGRVITIDAGHQVMTTQPATLAQTLITILNGDNP